MHYRFLAVLSHSLASLLRTAIGFAYAYRISFKVYDAHNVVLLELTPHIGDAYGKDADCLVGCKYFVAQSSMCSSPLANPSLWAIHFFTLDTGWGAGMKRV